MKISNFNQKLLFNIFVFIVIFVCFASVARFVMQVSYVDWAIAKENPSSIFRLYQYGMAYDLRIIASAFILPLLLGYICHFFAWGRKRFFSFFAWYMGLCGFLFVLVYFINYFYFQIYHTQIDIFIFGLVDDNTKGIFEIAFNDYPVIRGLLFALGVGWFCLFLARKISLWNPIFFKADLNLPQVVFLIIFNASFLVLFVLGVRGKVFDPLLGVILVFGGAGVLLFGLMKMLAKISILKTHFSPPPHLAGISLVVFNFIFLFFFVASVRGGFLSEPLLRDQHNVSSIKLINHLVPHPIMAFSWALRDYKLNSLFFPVNQKEGEKLAQQAGIEIFSKTAKSEFLEKNPPHIVLNLMESFGNNFLSFDDSRDFDLLGSLRSHFKSDFVFSRFLPYGNGTAASFSGLFFGSPSANIGLSKVKNQPLNGNPMMLYAQKGYEVIFITAGNASWAGYGDYMVTQGANRFYDANALIDLYPEAKQYQTTYGIPDEYVYRLLQKLLSEAKKPMFVCILTISNHPPEVIPKHYKPYPLKKDISSMMPNPKSKLISEAYQYANDSFGKFLDFVKSSPLKEKTIVVATGDHKLRSLVTLPLSREFMNFSVPLYFYIPKIYQEKLGVEFDVSRVGSHKDILPTLLSYSLSDVRYFANGGQNMFKKVLNPFAFNEAIFANEDGVYMGGEELYPWVGRGSTEILTTPIKVPQSLVEQVKAYREFQWWQIRARSAGVKE